MNRLSALRIEAGSGEAHAPALNSVSISRADPITPLVALLKGLPFSIPVVYVYTPRKNEAVPRFSRYYPPHGYRVCIDNVERYIPRPFRPTGTKHHLQVAFQVDREPYHETTLFLFRTFLNSVIRPHLFDIYKFNKNSSRQINSSIVI